MDKIERLKTKNEQLETQNQFLKQKLKELIRDIKKVDAKLARLSEQTYDILSNAERGL